MLMNRIKVKRPWMAAAVTALALLLVACRTPDARPVSKPGAPPQPVEVRLVTTEWKFEPSTLELPVGRPVTLILENKGKIEHDVQIPGMGIHAHAPAGQTVRQTFTPEETGTYDFICSLPGHLEAGMKGKMVVGQAAAEAAPRTEAQPAAASTTPARVAALPAGLNRSPQPQIALPVGPREPELVSFELESREITGLLDEGVGYTLWTFGGTVPGPMLRVRQGDLVELTFKNAPDSAVTHSIDLHAVTGPGGGATLTQMAPGGSAGFRFQALNPGVYVYHCATPMVAHHIANGMYGLIVVEPRGGLRPVDQEFYVMQGDFYLEGARGEQGLRGFSMDKMLDERPDYVLFNGAVGALAGEQALKAQVGDTVRVFFGAGGPNLSSSFHVIGEIFDRVYPEGATEPLTNVQTTLVPAGGAAIVEFKVDVPGRYILVDHSLGRLEKGAAGFLQVDGPDAAEIFQPLTPGHHDSAGH